MDFSGQLSQIASLVAAAGGVGTASFGLVDATKAFRGGISNRGFKCIRDAVAPYMEAFALVNPRDPLATIKAGWINGTAKDDQKAAVKSLIHLGLTAATAAALVKSTRGVDADALEAAAKKLDAGSSLGEADIAVLGRFDAIVNSQLDAGFDRADQQYRNGAKLLAGVISIVLALLAGWTIHSASNQAVGVGFYPDFFEWLLLGIVATPLAPVAKDVVTAINAAASALKPLGS